jgi:hypothetical protein
MTGSKSTASRLLSAFASGAIYEALSVAWVHQATHGNAIRTAIVGSRITSRRKPGENHHSKELLWQGGA